MVSYVYICSARYSGSTLLDLLIGAHSRAASLGEISHLPKNLALNTPCTCGAGVRACPLWTQVARRLSSSLGRDLLAHPYALDLGYVSARVVVDRHRQTQIYELRRTAAHALWFLELRSGLRRHGPSLIPAVRHAVANNWLVYDAVREILDVDLVVDSTKHYLKAVELYKARPGPFRIVLLTRDGRGVLQSGLKRGDEIEPSIRGWKNHYRRALPLIARHVRPDHVLRLKYEELAAAPARVLERICSFLGVAYEPSMLSFTAKTQHMTNGNEMRFRKQPDIRADESWRTELTKSQLERFDELAGELNRELGYRE
ncbi:MAG: sulfotransferase [bacterium]